MMFGGDLGVFPVTRLDGRSIGDGKASPYANSARAAYSMACHMGMGQPCV